MDAAKALAGSLRPESPSLAEPLRRSTLDDGKAALVRLTGSRTPTMRLVCLPFAGAGANAYRPWAAFMPPELELVGCVPPGRERRIREAPLTRLQPLVMQLAASLRQLGDLPYALFGHSMGALLGFEVIRELRRTGGALSQHLFVSGRAAPHIPMRRKPISGLPTPLLLEELRRMNGTPEAVLREPELLQLLLPILRADLELLETSHYTPEAPLDCAITSFIGSDDAFVPIDDAAGWQEHTSAAFALKVFDGDHFFLYPQQADLLDSLLRGLGFVPRESAASRE